MDMHSAYTDLYGDIVRDHGRSPFGAGELRGATARAESYNALCGDRVSISLQLDDDGLIAAVGHTTDGCLLCTASASLMASHAIGLDTGELKSLHRQLESLVTGETCWGLPGEMNALGGVAAFPSRRRCVLLPWETLGLALRETQARPHA
jgi:nitrogen fixation NifU-like protein